MAIKANHFVWHYHALIVMKILKLKVDSNTSEESRKAQIFHLCYIFALHVKFLLRLVTTNGPKLLEPNMTLSVLLSGIFLVLEFSSFHVNIPYVCI